MAPIRERHSARMLEIKNGRLGLYGTEHSKCNHLMTLVFKGLGQCSALALWLDARTDIWPVTIKLEQFRMIVCNMTD